MAVRVNGQELPPEAIEFEFQRLVRFYSQHMSEAELKAQEGILRRRAREQAIGAKLLIEEARRLDIQVSKEEVDARLRAMIAKAGGREQFEELMRKQNLTEVAVRQSIEEGRRVDKLVEKITEGVAEPTEVDIRAHYEAHRLEYMRPEQAQARHILVKPHSESEEDRAVARSRLMEIRERILQRADFADMAAAYSDCPSGRKTGGSLGWITRGTLIPEFERALFALPDGGLSDIIETPLGFHLISRTASEPPAPAEYETVREKIRDFLRHARRGEAIAAYVRELRKKAVIEED